MLFYFYDSNIKPVSYSELLMPKKEPAQIVNQTTSNSTDLRSFANNVSSVADAKNDSFGDVLMSKNITCFLGSSSGFKKAILSVDFPRSQATANLKSSKSKIIGFSKSRCAKPISRKSNTCFMTVLISAKINASSQS